jgi:hypothetical protein
MAFAGIFQPFERLRWIRFGLLMRDLKFLAPLFRSANNGVSTVCLALGGRPHAARVPVAEHMANYQATGARKVK